MLQFAISDCRGSHDKGTIGDSAGKAVKNLRPRKDFRSSHGGSGLAEGRLERVHDAQRTKPKIAHGACGCPDVQGIARGHKDHVHAVELKQFGQDPLFYR